MPRSIEYQRFQNVTKADSIDFSDNRPTIATPKEIGWAKQRQIRLALNATRFAVATMTQLNMLKRKEIPFSRHALGRTKRQLRKTHQS